MGLHQNGFRDNIGVFGFAGAGVSNGAYPSSLPINMHRSGPQRNITAGEGITDDKVGIPQGAKHPVAWVMPQKNGALSSHNMARGSCAATLLLVSGRNIAGTSDGTSTAQATLQLVVSMQGTAAGIATATGNIVAALAMSGSAAGSSAASATIQALAWAYGAAAGSCTATLTSYATGRLYGAITPYTELSPENLASAVWDSMLAQYQTAGSAGLALSTASSGGVDPSILAAAVWAYATRSMTSTERDAAAAAILAAAQATPIHSDARKMNGATIAGDGSAGNLWRGA